MYNLTRIEFNLVDGITRIYGEDDNTGEEAELIPALSALFPTEKNLQEIEIKVTKSQEKILSKLLVFFSNDMYWHKRIK